MELTTLVGGVPVWSWLVPPLAGAVIGWFTNYLAIRMLFRPLEKKSLFGLPLPLTPGIIPARRRELAKRIAEMVGEHLLTEEVIAARLRSPAVDDALYRWVAGRVRALIDRDLGPVLSLLPPELEPLWDRWWRGGFRPVYFCLDRFLVASELAEPLTAALRELAVGLLEKTPDELLTRRQWARLRSRVRQLLRRGLRSPAFRRRLESELDLLAGRLMTSETPLGELLPADLQGAVLAELHRELPDLLVRFSRFLHDPVFRRGLKQKLYGIIEIYINSMGFWQRLVTSMALSDDEIRAKIDRLVDEIADDFAVSLRQPEWQERAFNLLAERFAALLALSPARIIGRLSYARVSRGWIFIRRRLLALLATPELECRLLRLGEDFFAPLSRSPLGESLEKAGFGETWREDSLAGVVRWIAAGLASGRCKRRLAVAVAARVGEFLEKIPLGRPAVWLPVAVVNPLVDFSHRRLRQWLAAELPRLSENFAVRQVVEERINELPVLKVEELLLGIMREHFFYINLFGALVGGLIGLIQVLLMHFVQS